MSRRALRRAGPVALACAAAALAGCGGHAQRVLRSEPSNQVARQAGIGAVDRTTVRSVRHRDVVRCAAAVRRVGTASASLAAVGRRPLAAYAEPRHTRVVARFGRRDVNGYPIVFAVLAERTGRACRASWYRVRLPTGPTIANGSTGWIDARAVRVFRVDARIVVDLRRRRLHAYRAGREVLDVPVAVGAPGTPTPTGTFFVDERFLLSSADGPFGPAALGISARSNVLTDWVEGGPVALHGTDEPQLIGTAASHGCVRLRNDAMRRLFALASAGTPVVIRS
ncbi:MAG TPA: L,D-transpeptidase [Gaiellaceae bacterium]|nr:L,D-transpeptidase [Gaiellaceae bacterium]